MTTNVEIHAFLTRAMNELKAQRSLINKLEKQISDNKKDSDKTIKRLTSELDAVRRQGIEHNRKIIQIKQDANSTEALVQRLASKR